MKKQILFLFMFSALSINICQADVKVETVCYGNQTKDRPVEYYGLLLRTYYDTDLRREIGAFAQYNKSSFIPLVFEKFTRTDLSNPELENFELSRTEIVDGKVAGVYILIQDGAGTKQGKYLEYRNKKTKAASIFFEIGGESACVEVCVAGRCKFRPNPTR